MADARTLIFDLDKQAEAARSLLVNVKALVGEDDPEIIETAVEGETNLKEAVGRAVQRIAELTAMAAALKSIEASAKARRERFENQEALLREAVLIALQAAEQSRLECPIATVSLRGTADKLEIENEAAIPSQYWKPKDPELDKKRLLSDLKKGETVPGASKVEGAETLQVRFG